MAKLTESDRKALVADQFTVGLEKLQETIDAVSDPDADLGGWNKPWASLFAHGLPFSVGSGKKYNGTNVVSTLFACDKGGAFFSDPRWGTTNQWRQHCGWQRNPDWHGRSDSFKGVKKWLWKGEGEEPTDFFVPGEERRSTLICAWKPLTIRKDDDPDPSNVRTFQVIRLVGLHSVYNAQQIACVPTVEAPIEVDPAERYAKCQRRLDALKLNLREGGDRAYYHTVEDYIRTPQPGQFQSVEGYWSTMWHEVGHSTGHQSRLGREFGKRFGSDAYAFEELVAELSSVIVCAELGVEGRLQHHQYVASWMKRISSDPKALFTAAGKAQEAATWVLTGGRTSRIEYENGGSEDAEPTSMAA